MLSVANMLYAPSYVSFEYALSFYSLIPERVYEITSATMRMKKEFHTSIGRFTYKPVPLQAYALGIDWIYDNTHGGKLIATAEKALCDKIKSDRGIGRLSQAKLEAYLAYDLRIDMELLYDLNTELISVIAIAYKSSNLQNLAKLITKRKKVPNIHPAIAKMLEKHDLSAADKTYEALREILQEIVLLGLSRARFFDTALFYGGTALRILHGLDRFSEDLDFSLIAPDENFDLTVYEDAVIEALHSFGFEVTIQMKNSDSTIKSAFLKGNTSQHLLNIEAPDNIVKTFGQGRLVKIKFEVDTQPPLDFESEKKTLLVPSPFTINTMTLASLFAGKMHAILCKNWSARPKGRDWYDLVWYISHGCA